MATIRAIFPLSRLPMNHSYSKKTEEEGQEEAEVYEEEEHHNWLGGSTAVKYLLAGGVAGAGAHVSSFWPLASDQTVPSFSDMHRTVRPAEGILNYPTTRPSSRRRIKVVWDEGDHQRDNENIR